MASRDFFAKAPTGSTDCNLLARSSTCFVHNQLRSFFFCKSFAGVYFFPFVHIVPFPPSSYCLCIHTRRPLPPFHRRHFSETAEALLRPTSHQHLFTNPSLSFSHTEHVIRKEEVMASARDTSYAGRVVRARTSRRRWCLGQKAVCCGDRSNSKSDLKRLSSFQHA